MRNFVLALIGTMSLTLLLSPPAYGCHRPDQPWDNGQCDQGVPAPVAAAVCRSIWRPEFLLPFGAGVRVSPRTCRCAGPRFPLGSFT